MKRLLIIAVVLVMFVWQPAPGQWTTAQSECAEYDLTGRMFAASYRTRSEGVIRCVYAGRIQSQCPPITPDGRLLIREKPRKYDRVACFYATDLNGGE